MTIRLHTRIAATIAAVALAATLVASAGASSGTRVIVPPSLARMHEPGSTGYVPAGTLVTTTVSSSGLDWVSALVGAGAAAGVALASAGAMTLRRRRAPLHA